MTPHVMEVPKKKHGSTISSPPATFVSQGSVNGGFQTVVRVLWGNEIPLPPFYLDLTFFT